MSVDVDALRGSIDLVDFISRYVELRKDGSEFAGLCPFHPDTHPSLKVNPAKQVWACFSCGAHDEGADVFGFLMRYDNCTFPEALAKLSNGAGLPNAKPIQVPPRQKPKPRQTFPHPDGAVPDMVHRDLGEPVKVWTICLRDGTAYFYESRYLDKDGAKATRYWTWGRNSDSDPPRWECRHPMAPKPFYGLELLDSRPEAQVMIHEAPKKAEAARTLFPAQVHLGLIGGRNAVPYTDLAPLQGRRCLLLPDNDEVGKQAMRRLAPLLWAVGAAEVKGIDPDTQPDGSVTPDAWDIADPTDWTPDVALQWAKARVVVYPRDEPNTEPQASPGPFPSGSNGINRPEPDGSDQIAAPQVAESVRPAGNSSPEAPVGAAPAHEPAPPPRGGPSSPPLDDAAAVAGSPLTASVIAQPAKPTLGVVEGNAIRAPRRQEIEPEAEQLPAFSEFALAQRFADGPGQDWRHTAAWAVWAKWDGVRWLPDEVKAITWEARNCCSAAMHEHAAASTPAQRMKITTLKTVNAVLGLAGADPRLAVAADAWDADPMLLGTPTGVIDLRTGVGVPSLREQMISKATSVSQVAGEHPWWDRVLQRAHRDNADMLGFIHRWCGYLLTGDTREERFLFIHGPGAGGKSKFVAVLSEILGDYRRTAKMESFTARDRTEHSEEIARLAGARLVTATETEEGSRWNESRIKVLTGRDAIAARHMHKSTFEYQPQFKLIFVGNHRPALRTVGEEMRRRIDLIEWGGTIPEAERVLDLSDKLRAEYPAILAWMIEGCIAWQREGLGKPAQVAADTSEYLRAEDTTGAWLEECTTVDAAGKVKSGDAYRNFKRWAEAAGEFVPSQKRFTQRLQDRGISMVKSGDRYFLGFSLQAGADWQPDPAAWQPPD